MNDNFDNGKLDPQPPEVNMMSFKIDKEFLKLSRIENSRIKVKKK